MIVFVEGPRHSGKTFLLNKFFEQNTDPRVEYYKWYLVDWIKQLKLIDREIHSDVHYLSLGNILTILDQMKDRNDKIVVFDRALVTAYVWAQLRGRLTPPQCEEEIKQVLAAESYRNCRTVFVDPNPMVVENNMRVKDMWDKVVDFKEEYDLMDRVMLENRKTLDDATKNNRFVRFHNEFDENSVQIFTGMLNGLTYLINT